MKRFVLLLLCMGMLLSSAACSAGSDLTKTDAVGYTFTDSEGVTVTLSGRPQRIAILFSSYADIWKSAGGKTDITVYETVERGFADQDAVIVDSGSGHSTIDMETLIAAEPDLVIGTTDYESQRRAVELCRAANIPSALFQVESFDDYLSVLKIFCDLTGNDRNYQKYGVEVKEKIESVMDRIPQNGETKKILFVRAGTSAKSTKAKATEEHFVCRMLSQLGTVNIADSDSALTGTLSLEVIMDQNPDYLFITTMGDEDAAKNYMESLLSSAAWKELECVKKKQYCYLPKELFHYKPNAKWADAFDYLASILYTEK